MIFHDDKDGLVQYIIANNWASILWKFLEFIFVFNVSGKINMDVLKWVLNR